MLTRWPTVIVVGFAAAILVWALALALTEPKEIPEPGNPALSPECTAEDLDDGACLTWGDIRESEWHSQQ